MICVLYGHCKYSHILKVLDDKDIVSYTDVVLVKKEKEAEKKIFVPVNISCLTQIPRAYSGTDTLDFQQANMSRFQKVCFVLPKKNKNLVYSLNLSFIHITSYIYIVQNFYKKIWYIFYDLIELFGFLFVPIPSLCSLRSCTLFLFQLSFSTIIPFRVHRRLEKTTPTSQVTCFTTYNLYRKRFG
jgi:hypothetical protein